MSTPQTSVVPYFRDQAVDYICAAEAPGLALGLDPFEVLGGQGHPDVELFVLAAGVLVEPADPQAG